MGRPLAKQPELPSYERLHEMLIYDGHDGKLTWREREEASFQGAVMPAKIMQKSWNSRFTGKPAGGVNGGYYRVMIDGHHHLAHRVIWKMHKGEAPIYIDHIDGDKTNNRLGNLRSVSHGDNMKNKSLYRNNISGIAGVSYRERDDCWAASIGINGQCVQIGTYKTKEMAAAVRAGAEFVLNYHDNHGRPKAGDN